MHAQALDDAAFAGLGVGAEAVHVLLARLCENHVVAEVGDLHLDKVEHLITALCAFELVDVLLQAAQHSAATRLAEERAARVLARRVDVLLARLVETEVEPIVLRHAVHAALHLRLALAAHLARAHVAVQAANHARVPLLHLLAQRGQLAGAVLLQRVLEVDVLRQADLQVKEARAALVRQRLTVVLQAADHARGARRVRGAEVLVVLVAGRGERLVQAIVGRLARDHLVHRRFALVATQVVAEVLEAGEHARVVALDVVEAGLLVATDVVDVVGARVAQDWVEAEVRRTLLHHAAELALALGAELGVVEVLLEAVFDAVGAVGDVLAEALLVAAAGVEEAHREADVVGVLDLLPEQLFVAVPVEVQHVLPLHRPHA